MRTLKDVQVGETVKVVKLHGKGSQAPRNRRCKAQDHGYGNHKRC